MAIICTISPTTSCFSFDGRSGRGVLGAVETTRATLHFALCAKKIQMSPKVNRVLHSKAQIQRLKQEIADLKKELVRQMDFDFARFMNRKRIDWLRM